MINRIKLLIGLLCIFTSCLNQEKNNQIRTDTYIEYCSVVFNGDTYVKHKIELSNKEKIMVMSTLFYYKVPQKIDSLGRVYVSKAFYNDMVFARNVSQKSMDSTWLANHIGVLKGKGYIEKYP